jgi:hypothetical protein
VSITEIAGRVNPVDMQKYAELEVAAFRSKRDSEQAGERQDNRPPMQGMRNKDQVEPQSPRQRLSVTSLDVPEEAKRRVQEEARERRSFAPAEGRQISENIEDKMEMLAKSPRTRFDTIDM